jgi:hypothetical protein
MNDGCRARAKKQVKMLYDFRPSAGDAEGLAAAGIVWCLFGLHSPADICSRIFLLQVRHASLVLWFWLLLLLMLILMLMLMVILVVIVVVCAACRQLGALTVMIAVGEVLLLLETSESGDWLKCSRPTTGAVGYVRSLFVPLPLPPAPLSVGSTHLLAFHLTSRQVPAAYTTPM